MRWWKYIEPGEDGISHVEHILSDDDIITYYFKWWSAGMRRIGKAHLISRESCIDDWVTVHWAWEVTP